MVILLKNDLGETASMSVATNTGIGTAESGDSTDSASTDVWSGVRALDSIELFLARAGTSPTTLLLEWNWLVPGLKFFLR